MKNYIKKHWIWLAAAIVVIVLIAAIRRKKKSSGSEKDDTKVTTNDLPEAEFPLQHYDLAGSYSASKGSYGYQIKYLQKLINDANAYSEKLAEDGKYGPKTLAAFREVWGGMINGNGTITKDQYEEIVKKAYVK